MKIYVAKPVDIRKARAFLQQRGLRTADISPKDFATLAAEIGKSFTETLKFLAKSKLGESQAESVFHEREEAIQAAASNEGGK